MVNFTEQELKSVREAVGAAEQRTSAEIVPYVVAASGDYPEAAWKGAALAALTVAAVMLGLPALLSGWSQPWLTDPAALAGAGLLAGLVAYFGFPRIPWCRRMLVGSGEMTRAVHSRAHQAFLDEEVFTTRDRTGILLLVSLFERRIEVVGDSGINERVSADDWAGVVGAVREGLLNGQVVAGLVAGIERSGALLEAKGVEIAPDDTNELADGLRGELG